MNVLQEEVTACNEERDNERKKGKEEEAGGGCAPFSLFFSHSLARQLQLKALVTLSTTTQQYLHNMHIHADLDIRKRDSKVFIDAKAGYSQSNGDRIQAI